MPKAVEALEREFLTNAHRTNRTYVESAVDWGKLEMIGQLLLLDPQTSGGLLLAVDQSHASRLLEKLRRHFPQSSVVGKVCSEGGAEPRISIQ